jgi:hypothetical protein
LAEIPLPGNAMMTMYISGARFSTVEFGFIPSMVPKVCSSIWQSRAEAVNSTAIAARM